ncbi:unnamed protein product [Oikopleura dioica]|uniref:Uncharacterized protein n=1 Tax=Oikopleura dioica TaxID=34765 RepID=E4XXM1_OIKDI|nr:unnamed protein product [Oikopleura dioica]
MAQNIEKVKKTGTFEELVMLHRLIQNVHVKIDGVADKDDCNPERYGKSGHSGNPVFKLEGAALKKSGADGLLVCLPPKCGTTNYQKALAPLKVNFDEDEMKPSTVPEDFHAPSVYSVLPRLAHLDWINLKDKEFLVKASKEIF